MLLNRYKSNQFVFSMQQLQTKRKIQLLLVDFLVDFYFKNAFAANVGYPAVNSLRPYILEISFYR